MADLVERYLHAVKLVLPSEDILAELREDITSQLEEREGELGRALNQDEIAEILKRRGHPSLVAGRYAPARYLIGPLLYPIYVVILKLVALWVVIPGFALASLIVYATQGESARAMFAVLMKIPVALFGAFSAITLVFVALEKCWLPGMRAAWSEWDPRKLPDVPPRPPKDRLPRSVSIGDLVSGVFWAGLCLYGAAHGFSVDVFGVHCSLPPIWRELFWPALILLVAGAALGGILAFKPELVRAYSISRIAIDCGGILINANLFIPGAAVSIFGPLLSAEAVAQAQYGVALGLRISWASIVVLLLIDMLVQIARLRRGRSKPAWEMRSAIS